jgi:uncharacterized protein YjbK
MTEVEVKLTLESSGYRTLLQHFQSDIHDDLDQWNIFFDTPSGGLRASKQSARIRSIASLREPLKWIATVKRSGTCKDGIWRRPEIEAEISAAAARTIVSRPSTFYQNIPQILQTELAPFRDEPFVVMGDFRTFRRVIPFENLHLECDESILPDHTSFFEIEIEHANPEEAKAKISSKLNALGISFHPSQMGKLERLRSLPADGRFTMPFRND